MPYEIFLNNGSVKKIICVYSILCTPYTYTYYMHTCSIAYYNM